MKQLNGVDSMFLALDSQTTSGYIGGLIVFDPPADGGRGPDAAFMRERLADRLDVLPPLRWERVRVPLRLDHDYLAETARVDVHAHVRTVRLPAPGTRAQLAGEVARLMGTALQEGRPLWDLWVIEGLETGGIAHLLRMHHAVLDGGSMPVLIDLLSDDPTTEVDPGWRRPARSEPVGGRAEMLARGLYGAVARPFRMAGFAVTMTRWYAGRARRDAATTLPAVLTRLTPGALATPAAALLNIRQRRAGAPEVQPLVPTLRAPATPFNQRVTAQRHFTFTDLPLAELKAVGRAVGATLNDVVTAIAAGALRRYLADHGGVPDRPLIVCIPVGLRDAGEPFRWGNDVSMIFTPLPTHLDDPLERLEFASRAVRAAKANFDEMPVEHLRSAARFVPEAAFRIPAAILDAAPSWVPSPAPWNVVISNVRGPGVARHLAGARVEGIWPASFLSAVGGVNITLQSYVDRVDFGIVACREHVDEIDSLAGHLAEELALLQERVRTSGAAPSENAPPENAPSEIPPPETAPPAPAPVPPLALDAPRRPVRRAAEPTPAAAAAQP